MKSLLLSYLLLATSTIQAFVVQSPLLSSRHTALSAADSDVSFDNNLDGSQMRIGIIKTRWNEEHVNNLVDGIKKGLKECKVSDTNIFETSVPGSFELPMAARFLALTGTCDAIITTGVLIKGDTMHFEFIADAVAKGIMNIGLQTSTPVVFGVLTCQNEQQVKDRSTGDNNHGYDWGKTAVEMALLRTEALGGKKGEESKEMLAAMGFNKADEESANKEKKSAFFLTEIMNGSSECILLDILQSMVIIATLSPIILFV